MKSLVTLAVFFQLCLLAGGCATTPFPRLVDAAPMPSMTDGYVVFSQVKASKGDHLWEFAFRPSGEDKGIGVGREVRWPNGFYELPCGRLGSVWLMRVAPGEYQFGPWFVSSGPLPLVGAIAAHSINRKTYAPGTSDLIVRPNEVVYLGELSIDEESNNGAIVEDRWDCDWQYIKATWPDAERLPVRKEIANFRPLAESAPTKGKAGK